jgi:hypothetical protein
MTNAFLFYTPSSDHFFFRLIIGDHRRRYLVLGNGFFVHTRNNRLFHVSGQRRLDEDVGRILQSHNALLCLSHQQICVLKKNNIRERERGGLDGS